MKSARTLLAWVPWVVIASAAFAGAYGHLRYGHADAVVVRTVDGAIVRVDHPVRDIGRVPGARTVEVRFALVNLRDESITILGAETDCACAVLDELPRGVEPGGTCSVRFIVSLPTVQTVTRMERLARLRFDVDGPPVVLSVIATILPPGPSASDEGV